MKDTINEVKIIYKLMFKDDMQWDNTRKNSAYNLR